MQWTDFEIRCDPATQRIYILLPQPNYHLFFSPNIKTLLWERFNSNYCAAFKRILVVEACIFKTCCRSSHIGLLLHMYSIVLRLYNDGLFSIHINIDMRGVIKMNHVIIQRLSKNLIHLQWGLSFKKLLKREGCLCKTFVGDWPDPSH